MRRTCENTQELFVCSLSRLRPVVNRNGRKDGDTTLTRIIQLQGIYKQGLYKIITEIMGAGEFSEDCHKSVNIKEGVSYFPFDYAKVRMIYLERVWDRYCLIFFMILITSTCSQIPLSLDIYKRLSNAN